VKHIDSSFLPAGGSKHLTVLAVWPCFTVIHTPTAFILLTGATALNQTRLHLHCGPLKCRPCAHKAGDTCWTAERLPKNGAELLLPSSTTTSYDSGILPSRLRPSRIKEDLRQYCRFSAKWLPSPTGSGFTKKARRYRPGPMPRQEQDEPRPRSWSIIGERWTNGLKRSKDGCH